MSTSTLRCTICEKVFKNGRTLRLHYKSEQHKNRELHSESMRSCDTCGKKFQHKQSLHRHRKTCNLNPLQIEVAKLKEENSNMHKKFEEEKQEMKKEFEIMMKLHMNAMFDRYAESISVLPSSTSSTSSTTNTIQNQNNVNGNQNNIHIHINSFGNENMDYITDDFLHGCVNKIYNSVPSLIEKVHFDPAHPENHNIKIPNKKLPHASVLSESKEWKLMDKQEVIENIIDRSYSMIDEKFSKNPSAFTEEKRRHYRRFQNNYDTDDKSTMKRIKNDVELVLLNGTKAIHHP